MTVAGPDALNRCALGRVTYDSLATASTVTCRCKRSLTVPTAYAQIRHAEILAYGGHHPLDGTALIGGPQISILLYSISINLSH